MNQQANERSPGADFDANRAAIYRGLLRAEYQKAVKRNNGSLSGCQMASIKANATKKFFALEKAAQA